MLQPNCLELFAGAGGLALGLEYAGFTSEGLIEKDKNACKTLRANRPDWNVIEADVTQLDFEPYYHQLDLLAGGFPCQAFSYAGKRLGFQDVRGTLFYEFARAIENARPKAFLMENVKGLTTHDQGRTMVTMLEVLRDLGYEVIAPKVLKAVEYGVPQKRERLFIVGIRSDLYLKPGFTFEWPKPEGVIYTMADALKAGRLYPVDVPMSPGKSYPPDKAKVLAMVPPGGNWTDLPDEVAKAYMGKQYYQTGGRTGVARRMAWDEPCLTVICSPAQKQTERCHPEETRPLRVRECARIQAFPDSWAFMGSVTSQYRQIGNAVPPTLAKAVGKSIYTMLASVC
jgi:DNA (cytosine-5)-methyltransferase 1